LLAKGIEKMLSFIQLKQLNKLGGVIFGLIKVLLFLLAGVYFFEKWDETNLILSQETKESSLLYPVISKASNILLPELNNSKILEIPASLNQENNLNVKD
jgi:membrane protein required for colicin V production